MKFWNMYSGTTRGYWGICITFNTNNKPIIGNYFTLSWNGGTGTQLRITLYKIDTTLMFIDSDGMIHYDDNDKNLLTFRDVELANGKTATTG